MWYLPDHNPVILDEMRRRLRGAFVFWALTIFVVTFSVLLAVAILLNWPGPNLMAWATFSQRLWEMLAVVQIILVAVISPALTVGTFAGERERGMADLLWITPLSTWSIITGKFWGAISMLLLLIFAGLPVTAMTGLLGGVSPWEVLIGNIGAMMVGAYCASLGLLASIRCRDVKKAIFLAYLFVLISATIDAATFFLGSVLLPAATLLVLLACSARVNILRKPEGYMQVRPDWQMPPRLLPRGYPPTDEDDRRSKFNVKS